VASINTCGWMGLKIMAAGEFDLATGYAMGHTKLMI
jgi:hypothetical protein